MRKENDWKHKLLAQTVRSPPLETRLGLERGHACRDRSHLVQPGEERAALILQVLNRVAVQPNVLTQPRHLALRRREPVLTVRARWRLHGECCYATGGRNRGTGTRARVAAGSAQN